MTRPERPKVSVLMLTYNHRPYVEQSLLSALQQNTNFDFEIVVADDCSTDGAAQLLDQMTDQYPSRIRKLIRKQNLGLVKNFMDAYHQCSGEYVAILEGDDYWHNPNKLQRMVNLLEYNSELSFAFHDVCLLFEDGRYQDHCCPAELKETFNALDLMVNNPVPNCSGLIFRHQLIDQFPDWFQKLSYYDWPLHILHSQHGKGAYLPIPLSTYRIRSGSAWHGASHEYRLEKLIEMFDALDQHLELKYHSIFQQNILFWRINTEAATLRQMVTENTNTKLRKRLKRSAFGVPRMLTGLVRNMFSLLS